MPDVAAFVGLDHVCEEVELGQVAAFAVALLVVRAAPDELAFGAAPRVRGFEAQRLMGDKLPAVLGPFVLERFGAATAVDDLSFTVRPGVVTGFLGPNGAGKSTTMRMMVGLDNPTSGEALINGTRYRDLDDPARTVKNDRLDAKAAQVDQGSVGLPVGVQVVGKPFTEDVVLAVMKALEQECRAGKDFPTTPVTP